MNNKHEICSPNPEATIESIRSLGYDLNIAIADLVDNSIDSNASFVEVNIPEQNFDSTPKQYIDGLTGNENFFALIIDDGDGMDQDDINNINLYPLPISGSLKDLFFILFIL